MIDLHFHCLPAVDDGADTHEDAVAMCRLAAEDGCEAIVATPHQGHARWRNREPAKLESLLQAIRESLGDRPELHLGGEIHISSELLAELDDPRRAGFLALANSRYLLLELPRTVPLQRPEEVVHELRVRNWRPVIAHPEFYPELADDHRLAERMVAAGAFFQITAASLTGHFGRRARAAAIRLLDAGLVHFVASDAHGTRRRPPGLAAARRMIAARRGSDTARRLTHDHPLAVLRNQPLDFVLQGGRAATRA